MASKNKAATKSSIRPLFDNSLFLKHSSNSHRLECNAGERQIRQTP
ncbi:MAG: hypothetical protein KZQ59_19005 [Candidatus Thiodiazotropha sp. (ex Lucinoma aequizonata)]|nr:hypothetical protein [Candidatus Thiodiazotropha sp. (ex Lucinoma aequizonata)]MCU7888447.1 hypothetical protein [Candidatus Thiodiazotropha sp. (ex Lucinoma aequizonata)]MCU7890059.1 hypothetical protein [Candidatus Thiodiazotropha sp. (ex Lucinoma aequizonata)]